MNLDDYDNFVKGALAVIAGLAAYAIVALTLSSAAEAPNPTVLPEEPVALDFGPHQKVQDEVYLHKAGFRYECIECHSWQKRDPDPREFIGEHSKMNLQHGSIDTCFTCHHETEYSQLVDPVSGGPLEYNRHVELCVRCHGPIFEDWKMGAHGRRAGYWDTEAGPQTRTQCIICHDPHQPAFAPIEPLPPPGVARGRTHNPPEVPHTTIGQLLRYAPPPPPPEREPAQIDDYWKVPE